MAKKIAALLALIVAAFVTTAYAEAPSRVAVDANYEWALDTTISSSTAYDTTGASDSITFRTWFPKQGYEYILVRDLLTGANAASVTGAIAVDALDINGNLLYRTLVDSATAAAGEAYLLPIGQKVFGAKVRLKFVTYGSSGAEVIWNRLYVYKRRVMNQDKRLW